MIWSGRPAFCHGISSMHSSTITRKMIGEPSFMATDVVCSLLQNLLWFWVTIDFFSYPTIKSSYCERGEAYQMHHVPCATNLRTITWFPVLCISLSQRVTRFFSWLWRVEMVFVIFTIDSTRTLVLYCVLLAFMVLARYRALVSLYSKPRPQLNIWIKCYHWSMFEFLVRDSPKTSCTEHIAHSILSSLIIYSWYHVVCHCMALRYQSSLYSSANSFY